MAENNDTQLNIELGDEIAQGKYANLAVITHSSSEFILDFIRVMPGVKKSKVQSRVILTPEHTKKFFRALQENIQKFESTYGPIEVKSSKLPMNFGGNTAEA